MSKVSEKTDFISLVQDEAFIQRVADAENPEELLEELLKLNPELRPVFRNAFEFIQYNRLNKTKMNPEEFARIFANIEAYSKKKSLPPRFARIPFLIRVAAMILVILSIGSLVVYKQLIKDPLAQFAQSNAGDSKEAVIVLSDGSTKVLKNNDSFIDYSSTDGDVIVKNTQDQEIIGNRPNEKQAVLNQVVVPFGQRHKILLSDGTLVQLNAGSKLTFPATFSGRTREVYLKGEGFFEVHKNAQVPFIVKTDHLDVKVLGTTFNVSAYEDESFVTTVLVEGKVNVSQKDKLLSNDSYTIAPGQGCFYSIQAKNSVVKNVESKEYILWKDGLYDFNNKPLRDVISRVHKYFNKTIGFENEQLANTLVSGKLVLSDDLSEVMKYLSKTVEGNYEVTKEGNYILKQ